MAAVDFNKALEVKAKDVKAVPVPPVGHYVWQITEAGKFNTDNRWNSLEFNCQAVSIFEDTDDVDREALAEYGKVTNIRNRKSFMFDSEEGTETDLIQFQNSVKRFCRDHLQIEGADDMSLKELAFAAKNKRFVGQLTHSQDKKDPEITRANIGRTAPVEA